MTPSEWADSLQKKQATVEQIPVYERDQVQEELVKRWLNQIVERKEKSLRSKRSN